MQVLLKYLVVLIWLSLIALTEGLQCYQCKYQPGGKYVAGYVNGYSCRIGGTPKPNYLVDCPAIYEGEKVSCGRSFVEDGDTQITVRGCLLNINIESGYRNKNVTTYVTVSSSNSTKPNYRIESEKIETDACDKDKCNNSSIISSSPFILPVGFCLLYLCASLVIKM